MTGFLLALAVALLALVGFAIRQRALQDRNAHLRPGTCPMCDTPIALGGAAWTCLACGYRSELEDHPVARKLLADHRELSDALRQLSLAADQLARVDVQLAGNQGEGPQIATTTVSALRRVGIVRARYPMILGPLDLSPPRDRVALVHRIDDIEQARNRLARTLLTLGPAP